jgi:hypothetical protein
VLAVVRDLLWSSRVRETAARAGVRVRVVPGPRELASALADGAALVLVDLADRALDVEGVLAAVEAAGRPAPVVGWTTHVLAPVTKPWHGRCDRVLTREALTAELPALLRAHAGAPPAPAAGGSG